MWAVVKVHQYEDSVSHVGLISSYRTERDAKDTIEKIRKQQADDNFTRLRYISDFVDKIEIPEKLNFSQWNDFIQKYGIFSVTPKNFKNILKNHLQNKNTFDIKGFNPPEINTDSDNLFVVGPI